nr:hypothetical protein [Tanacetum cinerariifolium]
MKVAVVVLRLSHDGGDGVAVVMVGEMVTWWSRWWHGGDVVVVVLDVAAARGGEWCGGSSRSGDKKRFWVRPESSPEKFSGNDERRREVAGSGWCCRKYNK